MARRRLPPNVRLKPRKTGPDRYEALVTLPSRKKKSLGTYDTPEQAQQAVLDWKVDSHLNRGGDETCDHFANRWMRDYTEGRSPATIEHNKQMIRPFARDFAQRPLRSVKRAEARLWALGGHAPPHLVSTARKWGSVRFEGEEVIVPHHRGHAKVVRAMFSDAINEELADKNVFANLKIATPSRKDITPLTEEEVGMLSDCAETVWGDYGYEMYGPLIVTAAYSGMRPGELYALEWGDIDFDKRQIHIRGQYNSRLGRITRTKNREERVIGLFPQVEEALLRIPRERFRALGESLGRDFSPDIIFRVREGAPFTQRTTNYYWHRVADSFLARLQERNPARHRDLTTKWDSEAEVRVHRELVFYELRHFCGSIMALRGANPRQIAQQLGHRDGGRLAQSLYVHDFQEESLDAIVNQMEPKKKGRKAA